MNKTKEHYLMKWIERVNNGNSQTTYFDENLIETFHKPKKLLTNQEKHRKSRRFLFFRKLKEDAKKCIICNSSKNLVIDHCHSTRKIRGVICDLCNKGLGNFRDDPQIMKKAIQYLKNAKENENEALDYYSLQIGPRKP